MPPNLVLAPYSLTTIVVASFTLAVVHMRLRPTATYVAVLWSVGAVLILCSLHVGLAAFTFLSLDQEPTFHVVSHVVLSALFAAIVTVGLPVILNGAIPRERP